MVWFMAGVMIASFIYTLYMESKMKVPYLQPGSIQGPTANEGIAIPVVFGTREVTNPNVCWYGDLKVTDFTHYSDGNNYGYGYSAGMQFAICHGQLDAVIDILISSKSYLLTPITADLGDSQGAIAPAVWDPSKNPNPDGEVTGYFSAHLGGVAPSTTSTGVADYLANQLSMPLGPRYFGVATVTAMRANMGPSPYLVPFSFVVKRLHTRLGGTTAQWYDAKSEISTGNRARGDVWKYKVQAPTDSSDWSGTSYDDSAWDQGAGGIGNALPGVGVGSYFNYPNYSIPPTGTQLPSDGTYIKGSWPNCSVGDTSSAGVKLWLRQDLGPLPVFPVNVRCWHDDSGALWFNGHSITLTPITSTSGPDMAHYNSTAIIPESYINPSGPNVVAYRVTDSFDQSGNKIGSNQFIYAGLQVGSSDEIPAGIVDMNPAHIIREALTDPYWGMGYPDATIDDTSFEAAADTLYTERLGLSFVWTSQTTVEDFLNDVLRHITGALYVDRTTGLFTLKLIRADYIYTIADLPVLDETNISKIESATRKQPGELVNAVTVTYSASVHGGDQGSVTIYEDGLVQVQGGIVSAKIDYPAITSQANAAKLALRDLRMLSTPLLSCVVYAARKAATFNVSEPFVLTWPDLGINGIIMRVTAIELGDGVDNQIKVTCVEDVFFYPSQALTVPNAPILPPTRALPTVPTDVYQTALVLDVRNQGVVECLYTSSGEASLFSDWTEGPTGTFTKNATGPLTSDFFDGVDPDTHNTTGTSYLVGKRVLALQPTTGSYDKQNTGPFIVDDVGGHWINYGLSTQAYVSTQARMHRDPNYSQSANFVQNMIFQVRNGASYAGHFFQMTTANVVLETTQMAWTDLGTYFTFTNTTELLRADQLASADISGDSSLVLTCYSTGSNFPQSFPMLAGTPGVTNIPAGPWTITPSDVTLSGGDVGAITTLGFEIYLASATPGVLFELQTAALATGFQLLDSLMYQSPQVSLATTDIIVLIPTLHTNSTTPVTLIIHYNARSAITVSIPKATDNSNTSTTADDGWYDVTIVDGVISGFGDHRKLRVHGTGPLVGIDNTNLVGGTDLTLSFVATTTITAAGTPSSGAPIMTEKEGTGTWQNMGCPADSPIYVVLMTDSGSMAFWKYAGGSTG